jgi:host factor-I protein
MSPSSDFKEEARSAQSSQSSHSSKSSQPNIQDVFLNYVRREKLTVRIRMMDGSEIDGRIKNFDRFALVVDQGGNDQMVFKHAIAAIKTPKAVTNYFSHQ